MELIYLRCCGLDVHKASITACVLIAEGKTRQRVSTALRLYVAKTLLMCEINGLHWDPNAADGNRCSVLLLIV